MRRLGAWFFSPPLPKLVVENLLQWSVMKLQRIDSEELS